MQSAAAIYAPATGTWTPTATHMGTGRTAHTATVLPSGKVLVTGGEVSDDPFPISAEAYNPITDTWAPTASMGTARARHTETLLPSGEVLISGGSNNGNPLNSAELYQP